MFLFVYIKICLHGKNYNIECNWYFLYIITLSARNVCTKVYPFFAAGKTRGDYDMLKRIMSNNGLFVNNVSLVFMLFITSGFIAIMAFNFEDSVNLDHNIFSYLLMNLRKNFIQVLAASVLLIFMGISIVLLLMTRKILIESNKKNALIASLRIELEKQNNAVETLTGIYNNALEYDKRKTDFFLNMSHELKTPLTVILGAIQLIEQSRPAISLERRHSVRLLPTVRQNCYRLLRLINNILDITRLDSGYARLNPVNCNIVYLIEEITLSILPYAKNKGLELEFDTETEEIITAVDIDKLERILLNLLSNAIKFTEGGGKISVSVCLRDNFVQISVKDSGCGIPASALDKIFERFWQVNSLLSRENEGSGIGLSLVKSFVELHNGKISVSSGASGSNFVIELPVRLSESLADNCIVKNNKQSKIVEAINIEFSDIYSSAS